MDWSQFRHGPLDPVYRREEEEIKLPTHVGNILREFIKVYYRPFTIRWTVVASVSKLFYRSPNFPINPQIISFPSSHKNSTKPVTKSYKPIGNGKTLTIKYSSYNLILADNMLLFLIYKGYKIPSYMPTLKLVMDSEIWDRTPDRDHTTWDE